MLFSGLDFDRQHEESQRALDSLQKYIAMAKTAGGRREARTPWTPWNEVVKFAKDKKVQQRVAAA